MKMIYCLIVAAVMAGFSSCTECSECTKYPPGDTVKLCKKDYANADSYGQARKAYEIQGYDCK